jgi:hypothetical protein
MKLTLNLDDVQHLAAVCRGLGIVLGAEYLLPPAAPVAQQAAPQTQDKAPEPLAAPMKRRGRPPKGMKPNGNAAP